MRLFFPIFIFGSLIFLVSYSSRVVAVISSKEGRRIFWQLVESIAAFGGNRKRDSGELDMLSKILKDSDYFRLVKNLLRVVGIMAVNTYVVVAFVVK